MPNTVCHTVIQITLDLNRTRFWQLTINYTHGFMSQRRKENASPNQTGALKGSSSFSTHRSGAGIPAPFPLIHECAHAGAGKRAGKNFFTKKKAAAPFLSRCCYGPAGLTTDGRRAIPALALKLSTQACHSHSPHSAGTWPRRRAAGPLPGTPRRPLLSPSCPRRAAGPGCEEHRDDKSCRDTGFRHFLF